MLTQQNAMNQLSDLIGDKDVIIYDGECGFCHRWVQFVLRHDSEGLFVFCPRQGVDNQEELQRELGESIIVRDSSGTFHTRSGAVAYMLRKLGGVYAFFGTLLFLIPSFLRNFGYDFVAKIRHGLYRRPEELCPILPPELRERFIEHLPPLSTRSTEAEKHQQ